LGEFSAGEQQGRYADWRGKGMTMEAERSELLRRDADWAALAAEGRDIDGILSYWTDDAVVLPPDLPPVQGKEALREYVLGSLEVPGFSITWSSDDAVLSPDGNLACLVGTNTVTVNAPDGHPMTIKGRVVTIWRKDPDGEWRCAVDIWNSGPTA
jgi:ketosteroid isomerase-like protein